MTAIACLRIAVGAGLAFADDEAMAALVAKIAGAHLESVWTWPRRFGLVAPFSFVLVDPRATRLDAQELQALARTLQSRFFGAEGAGEVCLLMMEGDQTEVMRFAGLHAAQLQGLVAGQRESEFTGRICRITPTSVESLAPPGGPVDGQLLPKSAWPKPSSSPDSTGWRGIYHLPRELFVGAGVVIRNHDAPETGRRSADIEHDLTCIAAIKAALEQEARGVLFLPFGFSLIVKPSARAALKAELDTLPPNQRHRLAATVLDVPREPSHSALREMKALLQPHVAFVDLHVADPGFQIASLPVGLISSVTLTLEGADEASRVPMIRRFLQQREIYQSRKVWQGVTDISTRAELDCCRIQNAPFLSGPRVSAVLSRPVADVLAPPDTLPYRDATGST